MKKCIKIFFVIMFAYVVININKVYASENEVTITKVPYSEEYEKWLNLPEDIRRKNIEPQKYDADESVINSLKNNNTSNKKSILKKSSLPSKYNSLDEMQIKVKNQQSRNICWAFSFTSAAEIACKKFENETYEFSPMHIDYGCTRRFKDRINPYAQIRDYNTGGDINNLISYLTSGQGPILEEYMPFEQYKGEINYSDMPNRLSSKFVEFEQMLGISTSKKIEICNGTREYSSDELALRENIKRKIVQSGGVWCAVYMDKYTENQKPVLYSYELGGFNSHAVVIIGYDDNYSANNFDDGNNHKPRHDGAYIALNTWGEDSGDNGVFYISYDDVNVESRLGYIKRTSDIDYDYIYQHNYGNNRIFYTFDLLNNMTKQLYTANIFERDITQREELTKIYLPNTNYFNVQDAKLEVYVNPHNTSLNVEDLEKVESDVINLNQGECYINLNTPIELTSEKYAVVIKYILKDQNNSVMISLENSFSDLESITPNQSFYSVNGKNWNDVYNLLSPKTRGGGNVGGDDTNSHYAISLKAITKFIDKNIEIIDIKSNNSDKIYSEVGNEISAYISTTSNLNDVSLNVKVLKDSVEVTDKFQLLSVPNVKSRASDIKLKGKEYLEEGTYKLQVCTPDNIIAEKEFDVTSIANDERFVKLQYEDENFIDKLKKSIDGIDNNLINLGNNDIYVKKDFAEGITYVSLKSDNEKKITSIKGIETFKNISYLALFEINVLNLDPLSSLINLQNLNISNSKIQKEEVNLKNTKLKYLSMYNCGLYDVSKLYLPDTIISVDFEKNHIKKFPDELYEKARYISLANQTIFDEFTFEQNDTYEWIDIPEVLKIKPYQEMQFKNCEYDENLGKIKISTKNIEEGEVEIQLPWPEGSYDIDVVNPYGSKYIIKYKVLEKKTEISDQNTVNKGESSYEEKENSIVEQLNPKTGTKIIYIYAIMLVSGFVLIILLNKKRINKI